MANAAQQHGQDVPVGLIHAIRADDDPYLRELIRGSMPGPSSARARVAPLSDDEIGRFYCEICMECKLVFDRFRAADACAHEFCVACIVGHIESRVAEGAVPVRCPAGHCPDGGVMHPEACKKLLDIDVFDAWCVALCERAVGPARARCPYYRDCGELVVLDAGALGAMSKAVCPGCSRAFCLQCEEPWDDRHGGGDGCVLARLAEGLSWRRCPSCRAMIDKIEGCKRMPSEQAVHHFLDSEWAEKTTEFVERAFRVAPKPEVNRVLCPCAHCGNTRPRSKFDMQLHLCKYGFRRDYTVRVYHGESYRNRSAKPSHQTEQNGKKNDAVADAGGEEVSKPQGTKIKERNFTHRGVCT